MRPWVGLTEPVLSGIQSIWFLNTAVWKLLVAIRDLLVTIIFDMTYQISMLLGGNPNMAIAPRAELTQFLHLGVVLSCVVFHRQVRRIEDTHVTAETLQYASTLERQ